RNHPMKPTHNAALAVLFALAACGGEPENAGTQAHQEADADHGSQGDAHGPGEAAEAPRTVIRTGVAEQSGIQVQPARGGVIADEHEVQGLLTPIQGRVAAVGARFPGVVRSVRANVGDRVPAGRTLATIHSNLSLSTYTVAAPISGVVTARNATVGGVAGEGQTLFEISNLSELWVDLHIFGADAEHIQAGAPVVVTRMGDGETLSAVIDRILPGMATASQSTIARATIPNADGLWRPGAA